MQFYAEFCFWVRATDFMILSQFLLCCLCKCFASGINYYRLWRRYVPYVKDAVPSSFHHCVCWMHHLYGSSRI